MHINGAPQMMQSANMGVVPGAMPIQGPGQGPVAVGQGPLPVGPPGKHQSALHVYLPLPLLCHLHSSPCDLTKLKSSAKFALMVMLEIFMSSWGEGG